MSVFKWKTIKHPSKETLQAYEKFLASKRGPAELRIIDEHFAKLKVEFRDIKEVF